MVGVKFAVAFAGLALALAGCPGGDDGGGGGGDAVLPQLGPPMWITNGGFATAGPGRTGGNAGSVLITSGDNILSDDGRTRPQVPTNYLTAGVLADNLVTYAELLTLPGASEVAPTLTVPMGGVGFNLPAGVTLRLEDAPATITAVNFTTTVNIIIAGHILTTRPLQPAVDVSFTTTTNNTVGVLMTGSVDGRGAPTRDGGNFSITGTTTAFIFLSTNINLTGGAGDFATDAGDGGSFGLNAGLDIILPYGTISTRGGQGTAAGGNGGNIEISNHTGGGVLIGGIFWNADASGGDGGTGNGGLAGTVRYIFGTGTANVFCRVVSNGGNSDTGSGGNSGGTLGPFLFIAIVDAAISDLTGEMTGVCYVTNNGGNSAMGGNGGSAGIVAIGASNVHDTHVIVEASGGTAGTGGNGGNAAGEARMYIEDANNALFTVTLNGGDGGVNGGNSGLARAYNFPPVTGTWEGVTVRGNANGGNGTTGDGGNAGILRLGVPATGGNASTITMIGCLVTGSARGGTGVNGGNGGSIQAGHEQGTMEVSLTGDVGGGDGSAGDGGFGGLFQFLTNTGTATVTIASAFANGGAGSAGGNGGGGGGFDVRGSTATLTASISGSALGGLASGTGDGGNGGGVTVDPVNGVVANNGTATVNVSVSARAGAAESGDGGAQGLSAFRCGTGGTFTGNSIVIDARGGNSNTGNGGGINATRLNASFGGNATFTTGDINLSGGSALGGNGNGGAAARASFATTDFALTVNLVLRLNGGNAFGAGNGVGTLNDILFNLNSNADAAAGSLTLTGIYELNGGNAQAGDAGEAGIFQIADGVATTGGNVTLNATITGNGGNSTTGDGGTSQAFDIDVTGNITINGSINKNSGSGINGGTLINTCDILTDANIDIGAVMNRNGGNGQNNGAVGGNWQFGGNTAQELNILASAQIRANGGTGTTPGGGGTINLDPAGAGPTNPNLNVNAAAILEVNGTPPGAVQLN